LLLFATAPGECIAIGRSGQLSQTWIAKLTLDPDTQKKEVRLILGTTRQLTMEQYENSAYLHAPEQIDAAFSYPWLTRFVDSKNPNRRQLLVGRVFRSKRFTHETPLSGAPLLIDLDENKVMLLSERYPDLKDMMGGVAIKQVNDCFVLHQGQEIRLFRRDKSGTYQSVVLVDEKSQYRGWSERFFMQDAFLFSDGNRVYSPGEKWYCFDLSDPLKPKTEVAAATTHPQFRTLRGYYESAVFGIWIQYTEGAPWSLDPRKPTNTVVDLFKDFVPPEHYAKHAAAVEKIEKLGGLVRLGSTQSRAFLSDGKLQNGTILHLDEKWKGTPKDAELFKDLYRLSEVYCVNVPVGDAELRQLYSIPTISNLILIRTKVSEKAMLQYPVERLTYLVLENKENEPIFTDRVLELFAGHENIKAMNFSGPGFTDKSYELLKQIPSKPRVWVNYGSISENVFNKIKSEFSW
jgi:hypothetical protein